MRFVWTFLILLLCLICFLIIALFGFYGLLGYCIRNEDCLDNEVCHNAKCINACEDVNCGIEAMCQSTGHSASCECPEGYELDPGEKAMTCRMKCTSHTDCTELEECRDKLCNELVCADNSCSKNEICQITNHSFSCLCSSGYERADFWEKCQPSFTVPSSINSRFGGDECTQHTDCSDTEECRDAICDQLICSDNSCGENEVCHVTNHILSCKCSAGYKYDKLQNECRPKCVDHIGCSNLEKCQDELCVKADCSGDSCDDEKMVKDAEASDDDPLLSRFERGEIPKQNQSLCTGDESCDATQECHDALCVTLICPDDYCGRNEECNVVDHDFSCRCSSGFKNNTTVNECRPKCTGDKKCKSDQKCQDELCVTLTCPDDYCGRNEECNVVDHDFSCKCSSGFKTDTSVNECRPKCTGDESCGANQKCQDELCVTLICHADYCGENEECYVKHHDLSCRCSSGFKNDTTANECRPKCTGDESCKSDQKCQDELCVTLDCVNHPCGKNEECKVMDHVFLCTCSPDFRYDKTVDKCRPMAEIIDIAIFNSQTKLIQISTSSAHRVISPHYYTISYLLLALSSAVRIKAAFSTQFGLTSKDLILPLNSSGTIAKRIRTLNNTFIPSNKVYNGYDSRVSAACKINSEFNNEIDDLGLKKFEQGRWGDGNPIIQFFFVINIDFQLSQFSAECIHEKHKKRIKFLAKARMGQIRSLDAEFFELPYTGPESKLNEISIIFIRPRAKGSKIDRMRGQFSKLKYSDFYVYENATVLFDMPLINVKETVTTSSKISFDMVHDLCKMDGSTKPNVVNTIQQGLFKTSITGMGKCPRDKIETQVSQTLESFIILVVSNKSIITSVMYNHTPNK